MQGPGRLVLTAIAVFAVAAGAQAPSTDEPAAERQREIAERQRVIEVLARQGTRDARSRAAVVQELARLGPAVVPVLFGLQTGAEQAAFGELEAQSGVPFEWCTTPDDLPALALEALARLPAADVVAFVGEHCGHAEDLDLRLSGVRVLGAVASPRALDLLLEITEDFDPLALHYDSVRRPLRNALRATLAGDAKAWRVLETRGRTLAGEPLAIVLEAAAELANPASIQWLLANFGDRGACNAPAVRALCEVAAAHPWEISADVHARVLALAMDADATLRAAVATYVGRVRAEAGFDGLVAALDDEDAGVRRAAAWSLHELTLASARAPAAWRAWGEEQEEWWRASGAAYLAVLGEGDSAACAPALRELAHRPFFHERAAEALSLLLEVEDDTLVLLTLQTVQRMRARLSVPHLVPLLDHRGEGVSAAALSALRDLTGLALDPSDAPSIARISR